MESRSEPGAGPAARLRVVFAGGGTGGHLFPGIAVAEELRRRRPEAEVLFVGGPGRIEERVLPARGWKLGLLSSPRGSRGLLATALRAPVIACRLWRARAAARVLLRDFRAAVVVGLGGYAALPVLLAARQMKLPAVLLEQNTRPGRTNRFLAWWCPNVAEILVTFEESRAAFARPERVRVIGNPVRRELLEAVAPAKREGDFDRQRLLVVGGSQGAERLNELFGAAYALLRARDRELRLVHLTGSAESAAAARERLGAAGLSGEILPWSDRMGELYARTDLAVARAGATTLAELAVAGVPSLLVPYPFAADDHQTANAAVFRAAGAAEVVAQAELTPERLAERVTALLSDPARLREMSAAALRLARPGAARAAAESIERLAGTVGPA